VDFSDSIVVHLNRASVQRVIDDYVTGCTVHGSASTLHIHALRDGYYQMIASTAGPGLFDGFHSVKTMLILTSERMDTLIDALKIDITNLPIIKRR